MALITRQSDLGQQESALPSWLQRIGRRGQADTTEFNTLLESYNGHCAQHDLEIAAVAAARRTSGDSVSSQVGCCSFKDADPPALEEQFTCPACEQLLSRCHDLKKHWHDHCRVQVHQYKCKKCEHQTVSKTYPKKLQSLRREAANHDLELVRILPAKAFGCPCCGAYLANLKAMKRHVLNNKSHDFKQISKPDAAGQIRRLRGLLQQPDILRELEDQCMKSGDALKEWIASLTWDAPVAKRFADQLQYGVRVEPNGNLNVGILPQDMITSINKIIAQARGEKNKIEMPAPTIGDGLQVFDEPLELASQLVLEKDSGDAIMSNRHKRGVSTASSDISEGFLRSHNGPYSPIERLDFSTADYVPSPTRRHHLLHPIQTTGLTTKTQPIDSGYISAQPHGSAFTFDSSSSAATLFTSTSIHNVKAPWDDLVELPAPHGYNEMPAEIFYNDLGNHDTYGDVAF